MRMCLTASVALSLISNLMESSPAWARDATNAVTTQLDYRDFLVCGPNSLFIFMILCNHAEITFDKLKGLPISSNGTSLLVLRDTAKRFGVETEVRRYSTDEIDSVPLPAIGQFSTDPTSMTRLHFDVIYKVDARRVYVVNGTTGFKESINRLKLPIKWTGYAMVKKSSGVRSRLNKQILTWATGCFILADLAILIRYFFGLKRHFDEKGLIKREVIA